jgi:phospholipid/cholesterol/gamma-HCH transport system substrate-binding protein
LKDVVDASEKGLPAFDRILGNLPPLLDAFQPFLRNANPMVEYIGKSKREVTAFFANTTASAEAVELPDALGKAKAPVHYVRTAQILDPEALTFYPHPLGTTRLNPYAKPNLLDELASGLSTFGSGPCASGNVAIPAASDPPDMVAQLQQFAFRTDDKDAVAAPACKPQGTYPGFPTSFPQVRAEP